VSGEIYDDNIFGFGFSGDVGEGIFKIFFGRLFIRFFARGRKRFDDDFIETIRTRRSAE